MKTYYKKIITALVLTYSFVNASFAQSVILEPSTSNGIFSKNASRVTGNLNSVTLQESGAGTRLMWVPTRSAFRVGTVSGTQWDAANLGSWSFAAGENNIASGSNSTAIGFGLTASGIGSFAIGNNSTATHSQSMALGNSAHTTAANQLMARFTGGVIFYSSSSNTGVYLQNGNSSWTAVSDSTKKENFIAADGETVLKSISQMRIGTWNYKGQNARTYRHWGVMAQDFYKHFGKDKIGTIGDDKGIASADFDGVIFAAVKALEERTRKMQEEMALIRKQNDRLEEENEELKGKIEKLEAVKP